MTATIDKSTVTHLVQADTTRETYIGWSSWKLSEAGSHWPADFLYLSKREYYHHLDEIDAGIKNGFYYNEKFLRKKGKKQLFEAISSQLGLSDIQSSRALSIFMRENLSDWGIRMEIVAWSLCAYMVHSDENDIRKCHPQCGDGSEERFDQVANSLHISHNQQLSVYSKVQQLLLA